MNQSRENNDGLTPLEVSKDSILDLLYPDEHISMVEEPKEEVVVSVEEPESSEVTSKTMGQEVMDLIDMVSADKGLVPVMQIVENSNKLNDANAIRKQYEIRLQQIAAEEFHKENGGNINDSLSRRQVLGVMSREEYEIGVKYVYNYTPKEEAMSVVL